MFYWTKNNLDVQSKEFKVNITDGGLMKSTQFFSPALMGKFILLIMKLMC